MSQLKTMIFTLMMLTVPLAGCTGNDSPAEVLGCTNTQANNYNENVTKDDGSCDYDLDDDGVQDRYEVDGCTDNTANNFMISATDEDGSCDYDLDDDGVLDRNEVDGCTDNTANNYKFRATDDDGSCDYDLDDDEVLDADEILGCTDSTANNYNSEATDEDGSCDYDLDDDGVLDADEILGCTDSTANNYNSEATGEDGSCDYDLDDDGVLDADEILGCTDSAANNYNSEATDEDGSCDYDLGDDGVGSITGGGAHTCAILDNGSVSCWGYNGNGGLGDGTTTNRSTPTQTSSLGTDRTAVATSAGSSHTCAILDDGSVSCWGYNSRGQLGDGTNTQRNTPTQTSSLGTDRTAVAITGGDYHTCAILDDGSVSCWGNNSRGQLGDGTTTDRNTPTPTSSLGTDRTAVAITGGNRHTCAILDDGSVVCWGLNYYGGLGDGTTTDRTTPTQTSSLGTDRTAVATSAGRYHTCAILDDGSVVCWGRNNYGQLGDGTNTKRNTPTQTSSLGTDRTAVAITGGDYHTCAILDDGSVSCWGWNDYGQLGDGTTTDRNTPTQISTLGNERTAVAISTGSKHTCAILDNGSVSCWGDNYYGQLGDGTTTDRFTPTAIEIE
jgi:alpha-tubulin suppressor-like RCC1 family protein